VRILIVGRGSMGSRYFEMLSGQHDVCMIGTGHEVATVARHGNFDAALICTPTETHVDAALACIDGGIRSLFIEKPLALSVADAIRLFHVVVREGICTYVAYPLRFHNGLNGFREIMEDVIFVCHSDSSKWPGKRKLNGDVFELSHEIDLAHYLKCRSNAGFSLDIHAKHEVRYISGPGFRYGYKVTDGCYLRQIKYFLDNLGNPGIMNNIKEAMPILEDICSLS